LYIKSIVVYLHCKQKQNDMTTLEKIQEVATKSEIMLVDVAVRTVIDDFKSQKIGNWKSIFSFMESFDLQLIEDIRRRTWDKFGGAGMVMVDEIVCSISGENINYNNFKF